MSDKKEKLIINGNALYEIDLDCMERKYQKEKYHSTEAAKNMNKIRSDKNEKKTDK